MAVVFKRNQIIRRGDLDIFSTNSTEMESRRKAQITYALYYVDPTLLRQKSNRRPCESA